MICLLFGILTIETGDKSILHICELCEYKVKYSGKAAIMCLFNEAADKGGNEEM